MSRRNRLNPSHRGDLNVPTTELTARPPAEPNAPIQETTMPSAEETIEQTNGDTTPQAAPEPTEPSAKELARIEEENAARARAIIDRQQAQLARQIEDDKRPTIIEVAAQGMDALHAAVLAHSQEQVSDYVPPPMTERQMTQLEAEMAAGRRSQARHEEQAKLAREAKARAAAEEKANEGFTTPVHRPADMVPHPLGGLKHIQQ